MVLTPSNSESTGHHLPYDVRLETLLEEFSIILKEKNKTIIDIQEKLLLTKTNNIRSKVKTNKCSFRPKYNIPRLIGSNFNFIPE